MKRGARSLWYGEQMEPRPQWGAGAGFTVYVDREATLDETLTTPRRSLRNVTLVWRDGYEDAAEFKLPGREDTRRLRDALTAALDATSEFGGASE